MLYYLFICKSIKYDGRLAYISNEIELRKLIKKETMYYRVCKN